MRRKSKLVMTIMLAVCLIATLLTYDYKKDELYNPIKLEESIEVSAVIQLDEESSQVLVDLKQIESRISELLITEDPLVINQAVLAFLRKDRYGYNSTEINKFIWDKFAGEMLAENGIDLSNPLVLESYKEVIELVDGLGSFTDSISDQEVDFIHMMAVIDIGLTRALDQDYEELYYDVLFTWGGDLETYLYDVTEAVETDDLKTYQDYYDYAYRHIGGTDEGFFSRGDLLADIDGYNISALIQDQQLLLSEAIELYYLEGDGVRRYSKFIEGYGGDKEIEALIYSFVANEPMPEDVDNPVIIGFLDGYGSVKRLMLASASDNPIDPPEAMRKAIGEAFYNRILEARDLE